MKGADRVRATAREQQLIHEGLSALSGGRQTTPMQQRALDRYSAKMARYAEEKARLGRRRKTKAQKAGRKANR